MKFPAPVVADFTCPVCGAAHAQPAVQCRRCGAVLLLFARLAVAARRMDAAGQPVQARALRP
jgi:ribosomal protein S27E